MTNKKLKNYMIIKADTNPIYEGTTISLQEINDDRVIKTQAPKKHKPTKSLDDKIAEAIAKAMTPVIVSLDDKIAEAVAKAMVPVIASLDDRITKAVDKAIAPVIARLDKIEDILERNNLH